MPRVIVLLIVLFAVTACGGASDSAEPLVGVPEGALGPVDENALPPVAPVPDVLPDILAMVNGAPVELAELEVSIRALEAQSSPMPADQRPHVIRGMLDQLIAYRLLVQEARAQGVTISEDELDAQMDQVRLQLGTADALEQALALQGMAIDEFRADAREQMLIGRYLEGALVTEPAVTEEQIMAFYQQNEATFLRGQQVRASHILVGVPAGTDDAGRAALRTEAQTMLDSLAEGADFAELARTRSDDPGSGAEGGDLGFFEQGQMVPEFDAAAFSLEPGEMSDLVETDFGFHIIRMTERMAPQMMPLNDVRAQILDYLSGQNQQAATQRLVDELRAAGTIEVLI